MQTILIKQYNFIILLLFLALINNINFISIYSQEDPTSTLFSGFGKNIDKSIIPKEISPRMEIEAQIYDPREIIPIEVDSTTGNAIGTRYDDIIIGDDFKNIINGLEGNDIIKGLFDIDTLYGDIGNDILQGGSTGDKLFGGEGDDTSAGQLDDDYLSGGKGNDRLFGDFGDDTLQGGLGSDYFNCGDGTDNIIDYSDKEGDLQDNSCEIIN